MVPDKLKLSQLLCVCRAGIIIYPALFQVCLTTSRFGLRRDSFAVKLVMPVEMKNQFQESLIFFSSP